MQNDYPQCLQRLLVHEGGFTNDPRDPGGPTNFGITIFDARKYWKPSPSVDDMRNMPLSVAQAIYDSEYWHAMWCDRLPAGVDDVIFDYGVNSGNSRAVKVLQRTLKWNTVDGVMSAGLLAAAQAADRRALITDICAERMRFLRSLSTFDHFGPGWTRRVSEVQAFALQLASGATPATPLPNVAVQAAGRGQHPRPSAAKGGTVGTVATATIGAAKGAADQGHGPGVIVPIIIGGVVVAVVGWAAWEMWHKHRQDAPA